MTSTDPRPVVEMVAQEMPDVILLDVMMPFVSGLDPCGTCERMNGWRISHDHLTASDNEQTRMEALELGATDFLEQTREPC